MQINRSKAYSFLYSDETQSKPLTGISACLCGDPVRYDGQHKGLPDLVTAMEEQLQLLKVCPEVAIGMGVPRPPIQLVRRAQSIVAVGVKNPHHNVTGKLTGYAHSTIEKYTAVDAEQPVLCGFIVKSRSPSCGFESTPIHENGLAVDIGSGVFTQQLQQHLPWLPIIDELALADEAQQQEFIRQCQLIQYFWKTFQAQGLTAFHWSANKLIEVLNAPEKSALEELVRCAGTDPRQYLGLLIAALAR